MVKVQFSINFHLFYGGGNLFLLLEIKPSYLTPYASPDVLLDLSDPKGWATAVIFEKTCLFILHEISHESLTVF